MLEAELSWAIWKGRGAGRRSRGKKRGGEEERARGRRRGPERNFTCSPAPPTPPPLNTHTHSPPSHTAGNFQDADQKEREKAERLRFGRFFYRFPQGESGADVYDRITAFQDHLVRDVNAGRFPRGTSLCLVTHGLALRVFLMRFFHWTTAQFLEVWNPANAAPIVLERVDDALPPAARGGGARHTKSLYRLSKESAARLEGVTPEMCATGSQLRSAAAAAAAGAYGGGGGGGGGASGGARDAAEEAALEAWRAAQQAGSGAAAAAAAEAEAVEAAAAAAEGGAAVEWARHGGGWEGQRQW